MWSKKVSISTVEFALSSHLRSTSACKWPLSGDRPFSRGLSLIKINLSKTSLYFETSTQWEKHYWSTIHCQHFYLGLYYFSFIVFLKWSQTKWISVYQVLGGRLIDRVDEKGKYNFPFFSTILFHQDFDYRPLNRGWLVNGGSTAFEYHDQTKAHAVIHCINCVD